MADRHPAFVGDIPKNDDRYLGPVLFRLGDPPTGMPLSAIVFWARRP